MNSDNGGSPYFKVMYGGEKNKDNIRCIVEKLCGGPAKLDEAIEQGQVTVSQDENNVAFYAIKTMVCGKTKTTQNFTRIGRGQAIRTDDFAKVAKQLAAMGWNFKATAKQAKDAEEGKGYPTVCIEKMDSAKDASKKLLELLTDPAEIICCSSEPVGEAGHLHLGRQDEHAAEQGGDFGLDEVVGQVAEQAGRND